jgi:hypothetical protein
MLRAAAIWVCLYLVCLLFSFISEVTYKKRSIKEVRQDWKQIASRTTVTFMVFAIASIIWLYWKQSNQK